MTIQVDQTMPAGTLKTMTAEGPVALSTDDIFKDKKVVLFGVPGAFTPGCSRVHLPGYVDAADNIAAKGFDTIACVAVNDAWVMAAWGEAHGATGKVSMLADGSADYVRALGLELDLTAAGMGMRCKRFSMVVNDGVVESINIDDRAIETTAAGATCGL